MTSHWRHNDHDGVSNHQPQGCLRNRLFRRRSKKTSKLRVTGLCVGNSPGPVNSPHKGPVTRKMFPFDDVIMRGNPRGQRLPVESPPKGQLCKKRFHVVTSSWSGIISTCIIRTNSVTFKCFVTNFLPFGKQSLASRLVLYDLIAKTKWCGFFYRKAHAELNVKFVNINIAVTQGPISMNHYDLVTIYAVKELGQNWSR